MTAEPMPLDDPMRRSGARWCEQHGRWECSKRTKAATECHGSAVAGVDRCRMHGGRSSAVLKAVGEANLLVWSTEAAGDAALPALDPGRVVMDQLRLAVMRADLLGQLLREQLTADDEHGLVGLSYAAGREGQRVETGEQVRGLARLEAEWRDRVVRFAKTAHDMGIAEQHVRLEQERAQLVVAAFMAALDVGQLLPEVRTVMIDRFLERLEPVAGEVVA